MKVHIKYSIYLSKLCHHGDLFPAFNLHSTVDANLFLAVRAAMDDILK